MVSASPAKILIGITLNPDDSKELLSWAITNLAHPNDIVVALHVLVGGSQERKKHEVIGINRTRLRRAKAFVISVMGEFAGICQSKQVNMEARVGISSSVVKGLIEEVKSLSAQFVLLGRPTKPSNRVSREITRHCLKHASEGCSVVSVGNSIHPLKTLSSVTKKNEGHGRVSFRWVATNNELDNVIADTKTSPTRVLDICEGDSNSSEEYSSSFWNTTISQSSTISTSSKNEPSFGRSPSPFKRISSFLRSSFDLHVKSKNEVISAKEKKQPLLRCFSYEEIANATNDFHPDNMVGRGGYSEVYKGDLGDGRIIAVKRLTKENTDQKKEKEFLVELGIMGHVNHPNTTSLVGCCIENGLHLIFNFSPNRTLAYALHGKTENVLEWQHRYNIAVGVAKGLNYLHKCCKHRIIHRDIKASNVLLGRNFEPQIADFGLAKWLPNKWSHHAVMPIEGTFGYLAPEYFMHGIVDEKIDVFSFGVLLLEIITGRRPVDSSKQNLLLWAKPLMECGKIIELVDPRLEDKYDVDQMHRVLLTASCCVRQSSIWRPSMSEVLELLLYGDDSDAAKSWTMPKFASEEMDDYSMVFGYDLPSDINLDDI